MGPGLPRELRLDNYDVVIDEGKLTQAFVNSVIYTVFATVLCVVLRHGRRVRAGAGTAPGSTVCSTCSS